MDRLDKKFLAKPLQERDTSENETMTKKSKKVKSAGREQHRLALREKKMAKKAKKQVGLPQKYKKKK